MHPDKNLSSAGMKIIRIDSKNVVYIIIVLLLSTVKQANMGEHESMMSTAASQEININTTPIYSIKKVEEISRFCPAGILCSELDGSCLNCSLNSSCVYGSSYTAKCNVLHKVDCIGEQTFEKNYSCRYCYQTEHWEHHCLQERICSSVASPQQFYRSNCTVNSDIICLGRRSFMKNLPCNFTSGYRWSTALILSITLGGFGADRFYLGHWQEGIGKLFSFGGLGVWTLIDVMLISMRYLGPADGSLYI